MARKVGEKELKDPAPQEVPPATVRKLARTAGVSGFALAKGIIKGKELTNPDGSALLPADAPKLRAEAATQETAKIMGAKDADAKAAGLEAKLSIEQKLTPREVGALTGLKLNQANRQDVAKPTAAAAAYFAPNPNGNPKANRSHAQNISQSVGATAAYDRRVLADGTGLDDYDSPNGVRNRVGQNYTDGQFRPRKLKRNAKQRSSPIK